MTTKIVFLQAEVLRQRAAEEAQAGIPGPERQDISGTAAAFHGGQDAEPHQGMEYTAQLPSGAAMYVFKIYFNFPPDFFKYLNILNSIDFLSCRAVPAKGTLPLAPVASGADLARPMGEQTKDEWRAMALASGWTPEFQKKKAFETAFGSLFISLEAS